MTAIIKNDVLEFAPELRSVRDPAWTWILRMVNTMDATGIDAAGGETGATIHNARCFLAAHYATLSKRSKSGAVGPVTSEAMGAVRRSYGLVALASRDAGLGSTNWGQAFQSLLGMSDAFGPHLL